MSSILTNNSAMVALQTLKGINNSLGKVQSEISTGKTVESAKDNAAVWAISKVMQSDVEGFKAISDSLALGQATVGVALNGAEAITDLLTEIKGKIVNSQESNVDRNKIQTDIEALTSQISSVVGAAQFNGLNMLDGSGEDPVAILSSLDRGSDGTVSAGEISVTRSNLNAGDQLATQTAVVGSANGGVASTAITATGAQTIAVVAQDGTATTGTDVGGVAYSITLAGGGTGSYADLAQGDNTTSSQITYIATTGDTAVEIGAGLAAAFSDWADYNGIDSSSLSITGVATGISVTAADFVTTTNTLSVGVNVNKPATGTEHEAGGDLKNLSFMDVTTEDGAALALDAIENLIQTSIDTAASFGSSGRQIDTQAEFVGKLSDLLTSGIGTLVDADMEAASAKLQALQTQQQLGVQALSIANQAPQTILSLFR